MEMTPFDYHMARENLSRDLRAGLAPQTIDGIAAYVREAAAVPASTAAWFTERFFADLRRCTERVRNIPK